MMGMDKMKQFCDQWASYPNCEVDFSEDSDRDCVAVGLGLVVTDTQVSLSWSQHLQPYHFLHCQLHLVTSQATAGVTSSNGGKIKTYNFT